MNELEAERLLAQAIRTEERLKRRLFTVQRALQDTHRSQTTRRAFLECRVNEVAKLSKHAETRVERRRLLIERLST